jgi:hypothetical protein
MDVQYHPIPGKTEADEDAAIAIGYLAHFVILISKYLNVPLRYPLLFSGSKTRIQEPSPAQGGPIE